MFHSRAEISCWTISKHIRDKWDLTRLFKTAAPEGITVLEFSQGNKRTLQHSCQGKTPGHLSDGQITCRGLQLSLSRCPTMREAGSWTTAKHQVAESKGEHSAPAVILNRKQSRSIHFGRTVKFITPLLPPMPHTWQHLRSGRGLLWVRECLCLQAQKLVSLQHKHITFGLALPSLLLFSFFD